MYNYYTYQVDIFRKVYMNIKKILVALFLVVITFSSITFAVYAGGDKVQGDEGQGMVSQEGPCPFGEDTPAGPNN